MLDEAARVSVRSVVCRVGQVAKPTMEKEGKGTWRRTEWFPSLIVSSVNLGCLPRRLRPIERVDWVPVDVLAVCIGELIFAPDREEDFPLPHCSVGERHTFVKENSTTSHLHKIDNTRPESSATMQPAFNDAADNLPAFSSTAKVYHLVNPSRTTYTGLLLSIISTFPSSLQPKLVSFHEWVRVLQQSSSFSSSPSSIHSSQSMSDNDDLERNLAIKLLDFFENLA